MNKKSIYLLYFFLFLFFSFSLELLFLNAEYAPHEKVNEIKNNFVKFTNHSNLTTAVRDNTIKLAP